MQKATTFQPFPGGAELVDVPRDLRFQPRTNSAPKALTADQVDRFNREGYLKPFRIFESAEIDDIRSYFDRLLARYLAEGKDSYSISTAHLRHGRVWDILTNPRIVALVSDLLGPSVIGGGRISSAKCPGMENASPGIRTRVTGRSLRRKR